MNEVRSKGRKNKLSRYVPSEDEEYFSPLGVLCDEPTEKDFAYIENGDVLAMYRAGVDYEYGYGVRKNRALARMWYEKAAAEGYEGAAEALETLCNED